jgi:hypothetical protein
VKGFNIGNFCFYFLFMFTLSMLYYEHYWVRNTIDFDDSDIIDDIPEEYLEGLSIYYTDRPIYSFFLENKIFSKVKVIGTYKSGRIKVLVNDEYFSVREILYHEIGHHYWDNFMSDDERKDFCLSSDWKSYDSFCLEGFADMFAYQKILEWRDD